MAVPKHAPTSGSSGKSNRAKREARAKQKKPVLIAFSIVLIVLLCAVTLILFSLIADRSKKPTDQETDPPAADSENSDHEPSTESKDESSTGTPGQQTAIYNKVPLDRVLTERQGSLVLINTSNPLLLDFADYVKDYETEAEKLEAINKYLTADITAISATNIPKNTSGNQVYNPLSYGTIKVKSTVLAAFNQMMTDFYDATGYAATVCVGYRVPERQSSAEGSYVYKGDSDYNSGYTIGFNSPFAKNENFSWIRQNSYKYGFIIRYPEGKESFYGDYRDCTYILRYVGIASAYYMHNHNQCLEEYITYLKDHTFEGDHLRFTADNGKTYELYYVPVPGDIATVPEPKNYTFEVSGTNDHGFVVTVTRE